MSVYDEPDLSPSTPVGQPSQRGPHCCVGYGNGPGEGARRYELRHLIGADYVWSPERGVYRLTARGRNDCRRVGHKEPGGGA